MIPEIKHLHSPDIEDLINFQPQISDNFAFLLQLIIGPENQDGEESFDIEICTPKWLLENTNQHDIVMGLHKIIINKYDYHKLVVHINKFLSHCQGETWVEVSNKISYLGKWEFDNYSD